MIVSADPGDAGDPNTINQAACVGRMHEVKLERVRAQSCGSVRSAHNDECVGDEEGGHHGDGRAEDGNDAGGVLDPLLQLVEEASRNHVAKEDHHRLHAHAAGLGGRDTCACAHMQQGSAMQRRTLPLEA